MQYLALPLVIALLGASEAPPSPPSISDEAPLAALRELRPDFLTGNKCDGNALPTADNPGRQPRFERAPATAEMGQLIYAVDRRIDGCSVIMVKSAGLPAGRPFGPIRLSPEQEAEFRRKR